MIVLYDFIKLYNYTIHYLRLIRL